MAIDAHDSVWILSRLARRRTLESDPVPNCSLMMVDVASEKNTSACGARIGIESNVEYLCLYNREIGL